VSVVVVVVVVVVVGRREHAKDISLYDVKEDILS
jgi:hypothetical protein